MLFSKTIKVVEVEEGAKLPTRAHEHDAGWDLYANESGYVSQTFVKSFSTGFAFEIPKGWVGLICPRSGLAAKWGISPTNAPGVIDSDFRGVVCVLLSRTTAPAAETPYFVERHERIAQLVLVKLPRVKKLKVVAELTDTRRGTNGFGSTGRFT